MLSGRHSLVPHNKAAAKHTKSQVAHSSVAHRAPSALLHLLTTSIFPPGAPNTSKMEDQKSQSFDSLTEKMDTAHLRLSQSGSGKDGVPDTKENCKTDVNSALSKLAGELQDLIITNLDPSAIIALSQTNCHFNSCAKLHRLPFYNVYNYLTTKEDLPTHSNDYACFTCLRLKPKSSFSTGQTRSPREKWCEEAHTRICLECGFKTGKYVPSQILKNGAELQVYCGGCETIQKRFCKTSCWCDCCIRNGTATVISEGEWAKPHGQACEVVIRNLCEQHTWEGPEPARSGTTPAITRAMYEFERATGMTARPEWFQTLLVNVSVLQLLL